MTITDVQDRFPPEAAALVESFREFGTLAAEDETEETSDVAFALSLSERLSNARRQFLLRDLLPLDLAEAVDLIQQSLPTDDLSAVIPLLTGYSGLLKIGTRVAPSAVYSVPANMYSASVLPSGLSKTATKRALVDDPARDIRKDAARAGANAKANYDALSKEEKSSAVEPEPFFPHLQSYSPESLSELLQRNETQGLGQLVLVDELSGLLQSIASDARNGRGTAESQLLEIFDGDGFTAIRIGSKPRSYEACHVSVFGNVQPDVLKGLVNDEDNTGKFARFLFCRIPLKALRLSDEDPTDEELQALEDAKQVLRHYAKCLYRLSPRTYQLTAEARKAFNAWFNKHQKRQLLAGTSGVIRSLLGKTSAHALRVAGNLHLLRVVANEVDPTERIGLATVRQAMSIVDQLTVETEAFYEHPESEELLIMRHIHQISWHGQVAVDGQKVRAKSNRSMRRICTTAAFNAAITALTAQGLGEIDQKVGLNGKKQSFIYRATQEMSA